MSLAHHYVKVRADRRSVGVHESPAIKGLRAGCAGRFIAPIRMTSSAMSMKANSNDHW